VLREQLPVGARVKGPAILVEPTATSYVDRGFAGSVHASGSIVLTTTEA
jgi:N-methylhydantoinase A/oxoprolinase/acetone carboxylase beta subunit